MKLKHLALFSLSISLFGACTNSGVYEFSENQIFYPKKEEIATGAIMSPVQMALKNGLLIISSQKTEHTLFMFYTPSLEFVKQEGQVGRGPNEINDLVTFCHSSNDYLYMEGYTPYTLRKIGLGQDGEFDFQKTFKLKMAGVHNNMSIIDDSILIYSPESLSIVKYDLTKNKEVDRITLPADDRNQPAYDENRGVFDANDSYLVYAYCHRKEIDIYDSETFELIKTISDGKSYPRPDATIPDDAIPLQRTILAADTCFYVLGRPDRNRNNHNLYIEVFDYDGNPIAKYMFDNEIILFAVDHDNGYIYAHDYTDQDNLLRYDIKTN